MADQAHTVTCPGTARAASGFILAHREAYDAAYLNPSHAAASNEIARLAGEYRTLPPRHDCSCTCPNERRGWPRCSECKRLDDQRPKGPDVAVEIGRTSPVNAPMPPALMLDLERALSVLGDDSGAKQLARYMSLNGTSVAADVDEHQEPAPLVPATVLPRAQPRPGQRMPSVSWSACCAHDLGSSASASAGIAAAAWSWSPSPD